MTNEQYYKFNLITINNIHNIEKIMRIIKFKNLPRLIKSFKFKSIPRYFLISVFEINCYDLSLIFKS